MQRVSAAECGVRMPALARHAAAVAFALAHKGRPAHAHETHYRKGYRGQYSRKRANFASFLDAHSYFGKFEKSMPHTGRSRRFAGARGAEERGAAGGPRETRGRPRPSARRRVSTRLAWVEQQLRGSVNYLKNVAAATSLTFLFRSCRTSARKRGKEKETSERKVSGEVD